MFKANPISHAAALCVLALATVPAGAQQAPTETQRIEITGSNIKRLNAETASPVTVIRRDEIQQTGANTVRQVLDTITATTASEIRDNGNSASFAAGASGVSMRGLGKGATLVLLNGRRAPIFGLADGGQNTFVNIDSIPADVIERIEILKDGASAVYGSDAMAGVINIITRRNYNGVSVSANYQTGIDPAINQQTTAGVVVGFGDLDRDRFNVFGNLEVYERKGYMLSDVMGYYPAWHKGIVSPAFGDPSLASYPGNLIDGSKRIPIAGCSTLNSAGACVTDLNSVNQYSDPAKRMSFYGGWRLKLGDSMQAFGDLLYAKTQTDYLSVPYSIGTPTSPFRWFDGNAKQVRVVNKPRLAANNPANSTGKAGMGLEYRFMDPGLDWTAPVDSTNYRVLAGLQGNLGNWDWEASLGRIGGEATKDSLAPYSADFISAIESGEYKVGGNNSPELLKRMFRSSALTGKNHVDHVDFKLSGELFQLPAGAVQAAFGADVRREQMKIKSVDDVMDAKLIGRGGIWVEGSRTLSALYTELEAPLAKGLSLNGAVRYDKSSGYGGRASPKLGLRWEVSPQLLLRGTVGEGFRSPNIPEVLGKVGLTGFFNNTYDPKRCDTATAIRDILRTGDANDRQEATLAYNSGCLASVPAMISANPKLEPELSRSATLGFVFQPVRDVSVAVDYFQIERRNEISYRDPAYVLDREDQAAYKALISRLPITGQDQIWAARANALRPGANIAWSDGQLLTLLLQYENFGKTFTSGIDLDITGRMSLGASGTLTAGFQATYALQQRNWDIDAGEYRPNQVGMRDVPRLKTVTSFRWDTGPWTFGLRFNHTSATSLAYDESEWGTWLKEACARRLNPGELPCERGEDLTTQFSVIYKGIKNLELSGLVGNMLSESPPVDLRGGYAMRPLTVKVGLRYSF